ncbi:MAG: alanine dehydrogenase [Desulfuromonadaceae bacterium]|nr:alanine dehydrogenase [Desulfuromonadaceae bacterium]
MIVGVPKEIKEREYRVGITPAGARTLIEDGHQVLIEKGAGLGSGLTDDQYRAAGAQLEPSASRVYQQAELIVKVKEPLTEELALLQPEQSLFTFLHLAAEPELAARLLERRITGIAYETVQQDDGTLPLLQPMSEVAGRMSIQVGAHFLQKEHGGKGVLLAGAPGVRPGRVVVLGAGTVGSNAVRIAVGMGADVTVLDIDPSRLALLDDHYGNHILTLISNSQNIEDEVSRADLLIGAVLVTGGRAPQLVTEQLVAQMNPGSVIIDVAVDQGGCIATTRPTSHDTPIHLLHGVLHYGVANMPGAVSQTSTFALTNSTLPYIQQLARHGVPSALHTDTALGRGLNTYAGQIRHQQVAQALNLPYSASP